MYWANICLFDADMLVFLDESGFVSWHATYLHVQSCRVKIYFSFCKCWSPAKEIPQILRINHFGDIGDFCPEIGQFDAKEIVAPKPASKCKVQWVFVSLAFSVLQYKSLGLTEILLLWFYTSLIGAAGYINLVSSYVCVFNTWKHNLWDDKMQIILRTVRSLHWENKTYKPRRSIWLAFL